MQEATNSYIQRTGPWMLPTRMATGVGNALRCLQLGVLHFVIGIPGTREGLCMESNVIIAIAIDVGLVLVFGLVVAGPRLKKMWLKGPGGLEGGIDAGQDRIGARGTRIKAGRNVVIEDKSGRGADGERIDAGGDVRIKSSGSAAPDSRPK